MGQVIWWTVMEYSMMFLNAFSITIKRISRMQLLWSREFDITALSSQTIRICASIPMLFSLVGQCGISDSYRTFKRNYHRFDNARACLTIQRRLVNKTKKVRKRFRKLFLWRICPWLCYMRNNTEKRVIINKNGKFVLCNMFRVVGKLVS